MAIMAATAAISAHLLMLIGFFSGYSLKGVLVVFPIFCNLGEILLGSPLAHDPLGLLGGWGFGFAGNRDLNGALALAGLLVSGLLLSRFAWVVGFLPGGPSAASGWIPSSYPWNGRILLR